MAKPVFSFGTSRGGTTFFTRIMSVHPQVKMASDPFLPLFRSYRTEVIRRAIDPAFDAAQPLDDYYFSERKQETLKAIQDSRLTLTFPQEQLDALQQLLFARMSLAAKELAPLAKEIKGNNFLELFSTGLKVMEKVYNAPDALWCGSNDNWVIEYLPILAKDFPEAKFIVVVRDPRAAMASSMKIRDKFPTLVPLMYSFAHHWRKHAAFARKLMTDPLLKNRLLVFRYEDMVATPEDKVREICSFLNVEFFPEMLVPDNFRPIAGDKWTTYSRYEVPQNKIYTDSIDTWKKHLPKGTIEFIEFVCDPEMRLFGYEPQEYTGGLPTVEVMKFLIEDDLRAQGWRGQHESWDKELDHELYRKQLLQMDEHSISEEAASQNYLFTEVLQACRALDLKPDLSR